MRPIIALGAILLAGPAHAGERGLQLSGEAREDSDSLYRRQVALVIGIDDFAQADLTLDYAVQDASSIAALLEQQYGFDEVITLYNEHASREGILAALRDLSDLSPEDALLIFWAGHGISTVSLDGNPQGYLLPWEGSLTLEQPDSSNLSMVELRALIEPLPARHKLMIVDACYGGLMMVRSGAPVAPHDAAYLRAMTRQPVFQILTAGQPDQTVLDRGPGGHSVFVGPLLRALAETEDFITASELASQIQRHVREEAYAHSHLQSPMFGRLSGSGEFIFVPTDSSLDLTALPDLRWSAHPARPWWVASAASLSVGIAGLTSAALMAESYRARSLSEGHSPALFAANRIVGGLGVAGMLGTGVTVRFALHNQHRP